MSVLTRVNGWAENRAERQAERWRLREKTLSTQAPSWRTEARVRLLIRIYLWSLVLGVVTALAQVIWLPLVLAWLPFTVIVCVSWTMLRTVINTRDVAPDSELDEYEAKVLSTWQSIAYGWTTLFLMIVAFFMIIIAVANPDSLDRWVYTGGLLTILVTMLSIATPTIAYATTFGPVPVPVPVPPANN